MADFLIPVRTAEDWRHLLAEPEKHWRTGFSAKALAYSWQSAGDFPPCVRAVFSRSAPEVFREIEMVLGIPELKVPLPGGGRASQTDLFVLGKSDRELVTIAIEGKVAEPFDALVSEWFTRRSTPKRSAVEAPELEIEVEPPEDQSEPARASVVGPSAGKQRRLAYLCQMLELTEDAVQDVRYQLLHRTVSALIFAETFNADHALMLVHSFSETRDWFDDYRRFADLFGVSVEHDAIVHVGKRGGVELYLGWVTGDARWLEVYLAYVSVLGPPTGSSRRMWTRCSTPSLSISMCPLTERTNLGLRVRSC